MLLKKYYVHAFVLLFFGAVVSETCEITGPKELTVLVGEDAKFTWNATNNTKVQSATWGIKKGSNADPQYITVDTRKNKAYINPELDSKLFNRLSFVGDLSKGLAWFILRRVTVNDSNTYIASIFDDKYGLLPYTTVLSVKSEADAEYPSASTDNETTRRPLPMTHLQRSTSYTTMSINETRLSKEKVMCEITGPKELTVLVGEDAKFTWNATDNTKIQSATWGIKKGTTADPQYITVDTRKNKAYVNPELDSKLFNRLSFVGDLSKGLAWFILRRVTVNDSNTYIASIFDDKYGLLPYTTVLSVKSEADAEYPSASTDNETTRRPLPMTHLQRSTSYTTMSINETRLSKEKDSKANLSFTNGKTDIVLLYIVVGVLGLTFAVILTIIFKKKLDCVIKTDPSNQGMLYHQLKIALSKV